jgi:hypothetical protein
VALALVVLPEDAELDDALRDLDDLERLLVLGVLLEELEWVERKKEADGKPEEKKARRASRRRWSGTLARKLESGRTGTYGTEGRGELVEGLQRRKKEKEAQLVDGLLEGGGARNGEMGGRAR